ncbi:hypothetical protein K435DRAFT_865552 [Dendrothele bispora CBS 962.96]|uniref:Uncharacterized protein n=1 Tax=Dendrothele bispora (strain CBS 962.96) TaxID=1314807 RepID=A0A4S8LJJ2_DENBC|nr:hypothetical protein K435DRAFT_865552 [Dendrothele bispora CBS 962.96]
MSSVRLPGSSTHNVTASSDVAALISTSSNEAVATVSDEELDKIFHEILNENQFEDSALPDDNSFYLESIEHFLNSLLSDLDTTTDATQPLNDVSTPIYPQQTQHLYHSSSSAPTPAQILELYYTLNANSSVAGSSQHITPIRASPNFRNLTRHSSPPPFESAHAPPRAPNAIPHDPTETNQDHVDAQSIESTSVIVQYPSAAIAPEEGHDNTDIPTPSPPIPQCRVDSMLNSQAEDLSAPDDYWTNDAFPTAVPYENNQTTVLEDSQMAEESSSYASSSTSLPIATVDDPHHGTEYQNLPPPAVSPTPFCEALAHWRRTSDHTDSFHPQYQFVPTNYRPLPQIQQQNEEISTQQPTAPQYWAKTSNSYPQPSLEARQGPHPFLSNHATQMSHDGGHISQPLHCYMDSYPNPTHSVNYDRAFCHENSGNRSSFCQTPLFVQDQYANSTLAAHNKLDLSADPRQNKSYSGFPSQQWHVPQDSENNVAFAVWNTVCPSGAQPQRTDKMTKASRQKTPYSRPRASAATSSFSVATSTCPQVLAGTSAMWEYCRLNGAPDQCRWLMGQDMICGFVLNGCQNNMDANRHLVDAHGSEEQTVVCQWEGCKRTLKKGSLRDHYSSVHCKLGSRCKGCGMKGSRRKAHPCVPKGDA